MSDITPAIKKELSKDFQQWLENYMNERNLPNLSNYKISVKFQKKAELSSTWGSLNRLADTVGIRAATISNIYNPKRPRSLSYPKAKKLAEETGTDIALWLRGGTGTPELRRAAIESWALSARQ